MRVKIVRGDEGTISLSDLRPGQLAEIVRWDPPAFSAVGRVIQRVGIDIGLVAIGTSITWIPEYVQNASPETHRVRLLKNGDMLRVMGQI